MSKDLEKQEFKFVGAAMCYALMRPPVLTLMILPPVHDVDKCNGK